MLATEVIIRYGDGGIGLTGWGWIVFWILTVALERPRNTK